MLLVGDLGGTKTDIAIFSTEGGEIAPLARATFPSEQYTSIEAIARDFLTQAGIPLEPIVWACFAVAGPVFGGNARITNLNWEVDAENVKRELDLRSVYLLNDLEAIADAVPLLGPDDLHTISAGVPAPRGAIGVIAPGTGLGEAFLTWTPDGYDGHPSEGGHADFAPSTAIEIGLLDFLMKRFGHVSVERVCSGNGLPNIYEYLRSIDYARETPEVAEQIAGAEDPTPAIVDAALQREPASPLCAATVETFVSILGAEASNLALKVLATGGIYLGGGIPRRIISALEGGRFMSAFQRKGRMNEVLVNIPVHVIMRQAALLGAARHGLRLVRRESAAGQAAQPDLS